MGCKCEKGEGVYLSFSRETAWFRMYIEGTWHRVRALRQNDRITVETGGDAERFGWTFCSVDRLPVIIR